MNKTRQNFRMITIIAAALICAAALPFTVKAQEAITAPSVMTPTLPPLPTSPVGIQQTVFGWLSSLDTTMPTFTGNRAMLWTGASSIQGGPVSLANDIGGSYDVYRSAPSTNTASLFYVAPEVNLRDSGVAGTLVSIQGGVGAGIILYDVRIGLYADFGDYVTPVPSGQKKLFGEIGLRAFKGLGAHFATGLGLAQQFPDSRRLFSGFLSATF